MNKESTVFSQVMKFLPEYQFKKCVQRYNGNYKVRTFTCMDQFLSMSFAQLTYRESLRDIEACLNSQKNRLYHMGIKGNISRSTLAYTNENRDWRIYADFAQVLINIARPFYSKESFGVELDNIVYALDSSTIDLCLSMFPWAKFRKRKAAIKLHTLLDLRGNIPIFIRITDGKVHDVNVLDYLIIEPGSIYIMDRGYLNFTRLYKINLSSAFFITRTKKNTQLRRLYSRTIDKSTGLRCDQTVVLTIKKSAQEYPEKLRRIKYYDLENKKQLIFLTNNFILPALTIAHAYKCRWQVELFFKWIKQHLRIKAFYGTSENAVKTQIWIAISTYVLVAIIKKQLELNISLYKILQILSVNLFERSPILQVFSDVKEQNETNDQNIQLNLFDF